MIDERSFDARAVGSANSIKCPERMEPCAIVGVRAQHLSQCRGHCCVSPLHKQALGCHAPPTIRVRQNRHQRSRRLRGEVRRFVANGGGVHHPPDASQADGLLEAPLRDLLLQVARDEHTVLDDAAVHVHHVHGAVGRGGQAHRAEPFVAPGDEFLVIVGRTRDGNSVCRVAHDESSHQVACRLRDEHAAPQFRRQPVSHECRGVAGGGVVRERAVGAHGFRTVAAVDGGRLVRWPHRHVGRELLVHASE